MVKKVLKKINISNKKFNDLLDNLKSKIKTVDDLKPYYCGYDNKHEIMFDGKEYLICREFLVDDNADTMWKQVIVRRCDGFTDDQTERSINGQAAWNFYIKLLKKHYSIEEIDLCLRSKESEYSERYKQLHYQYVSMEPGYNIVKHENCYKYDINGAHNDALREIFPRAAEDINRMYLRRKDNPIFKDYNNFFVGFLCKKGYRKTYNWIVQRTTKMLEEAIKKVNGKLIYANTDGFMVSNPKNALDCKPGVLGKFKLEYKGIAYTYNDKNYWIMQTDKLTGICLAEVRDKFDLPNGKVVTYNRLEKFKGYITADNIEIVTRSIIYE